ncbi:hypothetical protein ACL02T_33110 [Pseudonocardia sp. RS010]|uniref:hypothetical protein n=1 Tax=Pseudonocardia sp. RS010 TaxID=3385979 RepID=UPI0039A212F3
MKNTIVVTAAEPKHGMHLEELASALAKLQDLAPAEAEVRVRTRFGANSNGSLITSIAVAW